MSFGSFVLLPNITGSFSIGGAKEARYSEASKAFSTSQKTVVINAAAYSSGLGAEFNFSASRSSSIYDNSTTVQPPALVLNYVIKY